MSEAGNWCLIESDPGVFTDLIQKFGVEGVQVEELWSLDEEAFKDLGIVHGLIFLFKWDKSTSEPEKSACVKSPPESLFFAKQMINNACATQAVLSVLLNSQNDQFKLGQCLSDLKTFTSDFDPNLKGLALSNCDVIRNVHNSFARQTLFELDQRHATKDDDVFHFVSYVPHSGHLYELDGLQDGPIDHGEVKVGEDWITKVRPVIQNRIQRYNKGEIHFNLMAVIEDKKVKLQKQIDEVQKKENFDQSALLLLKESLAEEERKRSRWHVENIRRRHNYLPLIINMLKMLGENGKLIPLYEAAKKKAEEKKKLEK